LLSVQSYLFKCCSILFNSYLFNLIYLSGVQSYLFNLIYLSGVQSYLFNLIYLICSILFV